MILLDDCFDLRESINDLDKKIQDLQELSYAPKNQVLSGMPKGGGCNAIEEYIIKLEKYNNRKEILVNRLNELWDKAVDVMKLHDITDENIILMEYHYYWGYSWSECSKKMKKRFPTEKWYRQKCNFRYRSVLSKIDK